MRKFYAKSDDGLVHLVSPIMDSTTLCGDAQEGACFGDPDDDAQWEDCPHGPVTCPKCAEIIRACRRVAIKLEK